MRKVMSYHVFACRHDKSYEVVKNDLKLASNIYSHASMSKQRQSATAGSG